MLLFTNGALISNKRSFSLVATRAALLNHNQIMVIEKFIAFFRIKLFTANIHIAFVFRFYNA